MSYKISAQFYYTKISSFNGLWLVTIALLTISVEKTNWIISNIRRRHLKFNLGELENFASFLYCYYCYYTSRHFAVLGEMFCRTLKIEFFSGRRGDEEIKLESMREWFKYRIKFCKHNIIFVHDAWLGSLAPFGMLKCVFVRWKEIIWGFQFSYGI